MKRALRRSIDSSNRRRACARSWTICSAAGSGTPTVTCSLSANSRPNNDETHDEKSGEWKDAVGFRGNDPATLQFLLRQVEGFLLTKPLPSVAEEPDDSALDDADIPF